MNRASKPLTAWVVEGCSRKGSRWLIRITLKPRRTDALSAFMAIWERGPETKWAFWRRRGYRLVRCNVVPQS